LVPIVAPAPLVGKATLTPADGAVLIKATTARLGYFNQPRLLLYCAVLAIMAAFAGIADYVMVAQLWVAMALLLFLLAIVAGSRTARRIGAGYGRGQEREIVLDDDGVTIREPGLSTTYAWERFERAVDSGDHIALLTGAGVVVVLKRAFDADTFARVRALVAAKVRGQAGR
ncbi:MAG TPA: YcxB family protein, partial [Candidatus Elarobacter sp.]